MTVARRKALRLLSTLFVAVILIGALAAMSLGSGSREGERGGQESTAVHAVAHGCAGGGGDLVP